MCPYCGRAAIVCDGCGWCSEDGCPNCKKPVHYFAGDPQGADGKRLRYERFPQTLIVEGKDWDGSDWFRVKGHGGSWFVNRRAKEWFERTYTLDMQFKPALFNSEGMKRE